MFTSKTTRAIALLVLLPCAASPVYAFRCGSDLIQEGDRPYEVRKHCGEPDFRDRYAGAYLEGVGPVDMTETWYYNPGPSGLVRVLTFRQGKLRRIETAGRGFSDAAGRFCEPYTLDRGMSKFELVSRCGEPAARSRWLAADPARYMERHYRTGAVLVEEWTYEFGSNRFLRHIRIVNGRITDIEVGEKGE